MNASTGIDGPEGAPTAGEPAGEVVHGVVRRITFHSPDTHFTVLRLEMQGEKGQTTVVGHLSPVPSVGEEIRAVGRWQEHPTYGLQFEAHAYHPVTPSTREGIERFLASGAVKGVGPVTARRLVEAFGERALDVAVDEPDRVAAHVAGLGLRRARAIAEQLARHRASQEALVFLHGLGLGPGLSRRILSRYGTEAMRVVRTRPYELALEVHGIGFRRADELAARFGIGPDDPQRVEAALWHALQEAAEEGHVYLPREALFGRARALLQGTRLQGPAPEAPAPLEPRLDAGLASLVSQGRVVLEGESVYLPWLHRHEAGFARMLARLARARPAQMWLPGQLEAAISAASSRFGIRLAPEQQEAVRAALEEGVVVVTGGPGTGKTTLVRFVVHLAGEAGWRVALCAPTGRAAQRLNEAVFGNQQPPPGVTGARTIHRLLEPRMRGASEGAEAAAGGAAAGDGGRLEFARDDRHPLEVEMLIVDEASMVDVSLAFHLVRALRPGTRLVLVGDVDQLPSVGPGQVLRDVIESGVAKVVRLARLFRQAARSGIVLGAHQVLAGKNILGAARPSTPRTPRPGAAERGVLGADGAGQRERGLGQGELRFVEAADLEECARRVQELVSVTLPRHYGLNPMTDIQVLAASRRGPAGCDALNELLQQALNPPAPDRPELAVGQRRLRVGDRVIQVRNDYQARVVTGEGGAEEIQIEGGGVFNGEIGRISQVDVPSRTVRVRFEDGRVVEYDEERLSQLQLAYAITVHKSQGNEFPCVVMPTVWTMPALMTRHLLYTAITRGRRLVVLVGQRAAVGAYIRNASVARRYTALAERLKAESQQVSTGLL